MLALRFSTVVMDKTRVLILNLNKKAKKKIKIRKTLKKCKEMCKIFVSNMALKCKNLTYLQLKFVKLFCKCNVILAEHTVASNTNIDFTGEFCVFTKIHTKIF
jgi:hypothetical protein